MKIYVGRFSREFTETDLKEMFKPFGHVTSVYLRRETTNNSVLYFGLVEMPVKKQAIEAITALDGTRTDGRVLSVHAARIGHKNRRRGGRKGGRRLDDPTDTDKKDE